MGTQQTRKCRWLLSVTKAQSLLTTQRVVTTGGMVSTVGAYVGYNHPIGPHDQANPAMKTQMVTRIPMEGGCGS